ncbi:trichohyalin isoform X2 [Drosophila guanche]|uniref:Uncharacterized protein n=1 Tax=Drosophila guanche TaxID=7266 RepID=A0A3B0JSV0_DROGU|nr:trichohyalin isoform X2 [Drosophila guanche]SPP85194.1 Hypothetical predicted protein [Drosophila guanche]
MPSDEALTGIGELIFSLLIGYLGALECALVVRHLYHCTFQHSAYTATDAAADNEELPRLRERLEKEIAEAAEREARSGTKAMQDGVLYDNKGLRVDPEGDKRAALAAELERQRQIEEETRRQLAEAQARLAEDRRKAKEADEKMIEQQREERRQREENERKLIEAEKQREAEQKQREEQQRKLQAAEEQREREENERKLIEAEREREANERRNQEAEEQQERQENEQRLIEAEQRRLEAERQRELEEAETEESERRLFEAEVRRERDVEDQEQRDAEIVERLLAAERARKMSATESELEEEALEEESRRLLSGRVDAASKQKMIEENARLFLEAEEEMVMLQQRQLQAAHSREDEAEYAGAVPVEEELCVKKILPPRLQEPEAQEEPMVVHKVKTQYRQSKGPSFPGVSDEGSSLEPNSSQQSSFSTQPSEDLLRTEEERPEPEGEDHTPDMQYTEDYLRSLDGIKSRPLMREDGSGRRRAFKKRRSSGSSNSSRDSRASRDEELKMFTSLEEEELRHGDREDYNPIKYTSEPTLRVKSHHRRHKRSPAKDMMPPPEAEASGVSLEMLGEESTNPWGEVMPEHYKDTEFWKREKALSIDEEEFDLDLSKNEQKSSSFEDATDAQNEEAATALLQQRAKEQPEDTNKAAESSASSDNKSNLRTSPATEEQSKGGSPGLRRSPRIDEMEHYAERWSATQPEQPPKPSINVQQPDTAPWRDQYGLMMEGLSDFYDFQASVNPSRSRSTSRNPSPQPKNVANRMDVDMEKSLEVYDDTQNGVMAGELSCELVLQLLETTMNANEQPAEQLKLQNVADDASNGSPPVAMVYAPTENSLREETARHSRSRSPLPTSENLERSISQRRQRLIKHNDEIMERLSNSSGSDGRNSPMETEANGNVTPPLPQPVIEINDMAMAEPMEEVEPQPTLEERRLFVETLRAERNSHSRSSSRSRSPLPTADNIAKSLESRRQRRIQHNDEIFEKLHLSEEETNPAAASMPIPCVSIEIEAPPEEQQIEVEAVEEEDTPESMARLFEQLRLNRVRSHTRSRSRSRSPLPSAANLEHSLERRRDKLIAQNDLFFEQLQERAKTPEPEPRLTVEYVYEFVQEETARDHPADGRDMRSLSPSRSRSMTPAEQKAEQELSEGHDFHRMLNLEGSDQRTLRKNSEEVESVLASSVKQRELDLEALQQLQHASEEIELRVLSPTGSERQLVEEMTREVPDAARTVSEVARDLQDELVAPGFKRSTYVGESLDQVEDTAAQRELQAAILDSITENRLGAKPKTFAEELKDTQRMKDESLASGFKRSTYVGEMSQDMSAGQLDDLRHRTAEFQRSRSQSRSPLRGEEVALLRDIDEEVAKRELQDQLLDRLAASSVNFENFSRHLNADFLDSERRASDSAILKQIDPYGDHLEPEEYHHFRRYSLAQEQPVEEYPSDEYVYISQIEVRTMTGTRTWLREDFYSQEPEDFECSKEHVVDRDSWARAVLAAEAEAAAFDATNAIYSYDITGEDYDEDRQQEQALDLDLERSSSNDSEDERQTVVEIDDEDEFEYEFDEGISDNNERTQPTDESHHDTSECEEAERNADRYANRGAQDWEEVDDAEDFVDYGLDDGAVGGATPYSDPDSFIEQIYNDAIKNRKQSGILREYETIVQEQLPSDHSESSDKEKSSSESERYALWAKTRELERSSSRQRHTDVDIALGLGLLESERRDTEMRYLGDAQVAARQSTRLRTRYGYNPQLQASMELEDDIEVDLNYKPKREYNWRKNFRLDDNGNGGEMTDRTEEEQEEGERYEEEVQQLELEDYNQNEESLQYQEEEQTNGEMLELRRMSLGGESITLFSRSPMREILTDVQEESYTQAEGEVEIINEEPPPPVQAIEPPSEKPKKKKSKKKVRKGSKTEEELREDNDSDTQMYASRRQDDQQEAGAAAANIEPTPKRKTRSRRSSKSSLNSDQAEGGGLFSPRSSLAFVGDSLAGIAEFETQERRGEEEEQPKKKTKKRKKTKELLPQQLAPEMDQLDKDLVAALSEIAPVSVSSNLTPESTQQNLLSSVSAGQSVCVTPASSIEEASPSNTCSAVVPARSVVDTFDILKDANFYPLF